MRYEPSQKHCEPWQPGARGTLCDVDARERAAELLLSSSEWDGRRYATDGVRAYAGAQHRPRVWHGWPVGWMEVPEPLRREWVGADCVKRRDIAKWWRLDDD